MAVWLKKIDDSDIFYADIPFKEVRDEIVKRLKTALPDWEQDDDLFWTIPELEDSRNPDEFDVAWMDLYDWADDNRVWINLIR